MTNDDTSAQLMTLDDVRRQTRLSTCTIYRRMKDSEFPVPIKVGNRNNRWIKHEVDAWIASQQRSAVA